MLAALEPAKKLKESVRATTGLRASLGWGDRLDHALYTKGFLVTVGEAVTYGGAARRFGDDGCGTCSPAGSPEPCHQSRVGAGRELR